MNWLLKEYNLFCIFGDVKQPVPWNYLIWNELYSILTKYFDDSIKKGGVRVDQFSLSDKKDIKFGKLILDDKSNLKWTHNSELTQEVYENWLFQSFEYWLPSWNLCLKTNCSPDIYFSMNNMKAVFLNSPLSFNPLLIIAFNKEKYDYEYSLNIIRSLSEILKPLMVSYISRKWAISSSIGFTESIQDYPFSGLFKEQKYYEKELNVNLFKEKWIEIKI